MAAHMAVSDEMLMQLADGELDADIAARVRDALADDADMRDRFALYAATRSAARDAFDPVLREPVPDRLMRAVLAADARPRAATPWAWLRDWLERFTPMPRLAMAGVAAALVAAPLGYLAGQRGGQHAGPGFAVPPALLARALESTPSGGNLADAGVRIAPLATHPAGALFCRDFAAESAGQRVLGVACREAGAWRLRAMVALPARDVVRPASADDPLLAALLERLDAAPPLSAEAEAALIGRGWR
jgi:anti-sigma factor RsiW